MSPLPNGHVPDGHVPASPAPSGFSDADLGAFTRRFQEFQQFEGERTRFLTEMVTRYKYMHQQYQALAAERELDRAWVIAWKNEKVQYEKKHHRMVREMSDNPFVMVLIDGDGMIVGPRSKIRRLLC